MTISSPHDLRNWILIRVNPIKLSFMDERKIYSIQIQYAKQRDFLLYKENVNRFSRKLWRSSSSRQLGSYWIIRIIIQGSSYQIISSTHSQLGFHCIMKFATLFLLFFSLITAAFSGNLFVLIVAVLFYKLSDGDINSDNDAN